MTFESFLAEGLAPDETARASLRRAYDAALAYAADLTPPWLVLSGGYGCGKTHLAAAVANRRPLEAVFVVVPDFLDHLRSAYAPDSPTSADARFESARHAPLLILDDLGSQTSTPWAREKLFQLVNHRYLAHLPLVVTTNLKLDAFEPRLRSRFAEVALSQLVEMRAPDFRSGEIGPRAGTGLSALDLHRRQTFESFLLRERELPADEVESLRRAKGLAERFAQDPQGWLVLRGTYGCGKTHLAAAVANQVEGRGTPVVLVEVPELLDHLRASYAPTSPVGYDQRFEEVRKAPLLVLDDLGSQVATPWAEEKLYQLLNYRYTARLPTVITLSVTEEELHERLRARMLDGTWSVVFVITARGFWETHRRPKGRS